MARGRTVSLISFLLVVTCLVHLPAAAAELKLTHPRTVTEQGILTLALDTGARTAEAKQAFLYFRSRSQILKFSMVYSLGTTYSVTIPRKFIVRPAVSYYATVDFTDGTSVRIPRGEALFTIRVSADNTPPSFAITSPKRRRGRVGERINFDIAVDDNSGGVVPASVEVTVDDKRPADLRVSEQRILFSHTFTQIGRPVIRISGTDFNGNTTTQTFRLRTREPIRPEFDGGFGISTSYGNTTAGQSPELSAATGLDASFSFGPLFIGAFGSLDLFDPIFTGQPGQPLNRYGIGAGFDTLLLDARLNAGYSTPSISDFTLSDLEINGYEAELGLLTLLHLKATYGVVQVGVIKDNQLTAAERRVLAVEPSINLFNLLDVGVGISLITDHDSPQPFQTRAVTPEANYVINPHAGLHLGRFSLRTDLALSLHFTDVTEYLTTDDIDALADAFDLDANTTALIKSYLTPDVLNIVRLPDLTDPALLLQVLTATDLAFGANLEVPLLIADATVDYRLVGKQFQSLGGESPRDTKELTIGLETGLFKFLGLPEIAAEYGIGEDNVPLLADLIGLIGDGDSDALTDYLIPGSQPGESSGSLEDKNFEEHYELSVEIERGRFTVTPFVESDISYDIPLAWLTLLPFSTNLCQDQPGPFSCESVTEVGAEVGLSVFSLSYALSNTHTEERVVEGGDLEVIDEFENILGIGARSGGLRFNITFRIPGSLGQIFEKLAGVIRREESGDVEVDFRLGNLSLGIDQEEDEPRAYEVGYRIGPFSTKTRLVGETLDELELGQLEAGYNIKLSPASRVNIALRYGVDVLLVSASYDLRF